MPFVSEVISRSDTDSSVEGRGLHRVSTIVTLTTAVHPTTCSRVQQFSLWQQVAISQALPDGRGLAARVLFPKRCDANG